MRKFSTSVVEPRLSQPVDHERRFLRTAARRFPTPDGLAGPEWVAIRSRSCSRERRSKRREAGDVADSRRHVCRRDFGFTRYVSSPGDRGRLSSRSQSVRCRSLTVPTGCLASSETAI